MSDPRNRRTRGSGLGARPKAFSPSRGGVLEFLLERRRIVIVVLIVAFFAVVALGTTAGSPDAEEQQADLTARVQEAMVRAGLPTVEVKMVDATAVLDGRVETTDLQVAATRVAQAQVGVIGVENRLRVPVPVTETTTTVPDLPATQADLLLQTRLSAAGAHPPIQFESGGDRITLESVPTLDRLAGFLLIHPQIRVQILGHTDSDERCPGDNLVLSQRRAEEVRTQLLARGAEAERLTATGMGHTDPIADNLTKSGKAANRRIEFLLVTKDLGGIPAPFQPETTSDC
ncbi:MAG: OmpA family protein [Actinomycetota bacterium]|nr:OmpA family protein [Actinomycetota bacterium]